MIDQPFKVGIFPLPKGAEDVSEAPKALQLVCSVERVAVDWLSLLRLGGMKGKGDCGMDRLTVPYGAVGRYSDLLLQHHRDQAVYLFTLPREHVGRVLRRRQLGDLQTAFEPVQGRVDEVGLAVWHGLGQLG